MKILMGFSKFFMQNPILVLTLLAHVLADFQLSKSENGRAKKPKVEFLILHLGIVLLPLLLLGLVYLSICHISAWSGSVMRLLTS